MKRAIVVVSFGVVDRYVRKDSIEMIEEKIRNEFTNYKVLRAFTSDRIIEIIQKNENVEIMNPRNVLEKLKEEKYDEVYLQSLHIIPGLEYHEIISIVKDYKPFFKVISLGKPLLYFGNDYTSVITVLKKSVPKINNDERIIFMGHGSDHPSNASYSTLQLMINDENLPIYIGTLKGYPKLENVINKLKRDNISKVLLMPFMVTRGRHVKIDMAGDNKNSWKNILLREGFKVSIDAKSLGEKKEFQDFYLKKVREMIAKY